MVDIGNIIDSLVADCDKGLIPDTAEDTKVVVSKEGQIGEVLAGLMVEKFRRFGDSLMVFNGMYYEKIKPDDIRRLVQGFLTKMGVGPAYLSRSCSHIHRMVMDNPFVRDFVPSRNIIYMKNCVLVLGRDGQIEVTYHTPELMSNIYLDIPYHEGAECPKWEEFLVTVMVEPSAVMVFQEFLGCMFIDKKMLSVEKALFLYGIGSNGKSVIHDILEDILGKNMAASGLDQVTGSTGDYYLADLIGKLLAYSSDLEAKDLGSGVFKKLVSKETVACRPIRQSPIESDDWPLFIANMNKSLITTDSSDGFWRRNIVIGMPRIFSDNPDEALGQLKADKGFKGSLRNEYSGIFNWILAGRQRILRQRGVFTKSKSIDELIEDMRTGSTGVYAYLSDKRYSPCQNAEGTGILRKEFAFDLYRDYKDWCVENGYKESKNVNRFKDDMINAKFTWKRSLRIGTSVSTGYIFYELPETSEVEIDAGESDEDLPTFFGEDEDSL